MIDVSEIESGLIAIISDEWQKQGHRLTGKFEESMTTEIEQNGTDTIITLYDNTGQGYGKILDDGVQASQIKYPFARARIAGLTQYAILRMGASAKDAVSIAYAIATKHAKEGMPLPSSVRFSSTGNRTHFVSDAEKQINDLVESVMNKQLEAVL